MTVAFVTSLRHPDNATDYAAVERLLEQTLHSIANQGSDDWFAIVVGNRAPAFPLPARVRFVPVDFAPPAAAVGPHANRDGFVRDKGTKIGIALAAARDASPDHVMIFDADDFVDRDLVGFVGRGGKEVGWVVTEGLRYSRARNVLQRQPIFNRRCGTCFVLPFPTYGVPADLAVTATQDEVVAAFGDTLPNLLGTHRDAFAWLTARGVAPRAFPFPAAVYHVDTGENHSGKMMRGAGLPLGRRAAERYGIPRRLSPVRTWWSAVGPRALLESAAHLAAVGRGRARRVVRRVLPRSAVAG